MIIWLHRALIWVFKTASGWVKIASKVEGKISVHHCLLLHAQQRYVISYFIDIQLLSKQKLLFQLRSSHIGVPLRQADGTFEVCSAQQNFVALRNYVRTGDVT